MKFAGLMLGCLALGAGTQSLALGALAEVTIVDRDSGATLPLIYHHGEYWVAGTPGARYSIRIGNRSGARVLAVTSVDGLNVLTGASAAWGQSGYVLDPGESYDIGGWRKSDSEVAAFTFTSVADSYAGRTGRPQNVGVVGVALFRERAALSYAPSPEARSRAEAGAPAPAAADSMSGGLREENRAALARAPQAPQLGTGHGAREYSYVQQTTFERAQERPNEVVRIRYDSLENLIALGVVPRPRPLPVRPEAFPGSSAAHYVPDPPG